MFRSLLNTIFRAKRHKQQVQEGHEPTVSSVFSYSAHPPVPTPKNGFLVPENAFLMPQMTICQTHISDEQNSSLMPEIRLKTVIQYTQHVPSTHPRPISKISFDYYQICIIYPMNQPKHPQRNPLLSLRPVSSPARCIRRTKPGEDQPGFHTAEPIVFVRCIPILSCLKVVESLSWHFRRYGYQIFVWLSKLIEMATGSPDTFLATPNTLRYSRYMREHMRGTEPNIRYYIIFIL